ncbi:MAG: efflux RND transporter periplasmic adaptor subunit [Sphaerochaetaceae bacterium]
MSEKNSSESKLRTSLKKKRRQKRIKRLITWLIVLLILAGGLYTYRYYNTHGALPFIGSAKLTKDAGEKTQEQTAQVQEIEFSQTIDLSGFVVAYDTQSVVFRSTGAVTGVNVKKGDQVKKGDLLATIDDTSQLYNLASIESQIEEAELEGSQRRLELLEMQRKMAINNLDYTKAYANFEGVVAAVSVDEGDYFQAGDAVMVVIDRSKLKATVEIDEIDIQSVNVGMVAELTFDALAGQTVEAEVTNIPMVGRTTNQGIGVLDVEIVINDPPPEIAPGFTFAGTITADEVKKILVVPASAVTSARRGSDTIRKREANGAVVTVEVTTKYLGEGMSEILSGKIKAGDTVLTGASSNTGLNFMIPNGGRGLF